MKKNHLISHLNSEKGVSAVVVAICLIMLVGLVALAIDVGHIYVARNELQNAADAGALAGAMELYNDDLTAINANANQVAFDTAVANIADRSSVEVKDPLSNVGDVQRGHWSLQTRTFTPNPSLEFAPLAGRSWIDLDTDTNFINAVRVRTRREDTPIISFFARIFKRMGFIGVTEAVAYIGTAGSEMTAEIDAPIAICAQSVVQNAGSAPDPFDPSAPPPSETPCWELDGGWSNCTVSCSSGSMLDSGTDAGQPTSSHNTAAWINFTTEDTGGCDQADASDMDKLVCKGDAALPDGVDTTIEDGEHVGATGGVQASTYKKLKKCWEGASNCLVEDDQGNCLDSLPVDSEDADLVPEWTWKMKLPVVNCPGNNVEGCPEVVGVICVELIWMTGTGTPDPSLETPYKMAKWNTDDDGNFVPGPIWDVMDGDISDSIPFPSFAELNDYLQSQQPDPNKPTPLDSYFQPQTFTCSSDETFTTRLGINQIPAPLSLNDSPPNLGLLFTNGSPESDLAQSLFNNVTSQYSYTQDFLKIPDTGTARYDSQNICTSEQLYDAFLQRQADAAGMGRWYSFVYNFKLATYDGKPASLGKKTLYYTPECECKGQGLGTGGIFLGVLAKEPVLVR